MILDSTHHATAIINGKLYSTEKAKLLSDAENDRALFVTDKGNYFSSKRYDNAHYDYGTGNVISTLCYFDLRAETESYAKENIGRYNIDKYIELFGKVEEA